MERATEASDEQVVSGGDDRVVIGKTSSDGWAATRSWSSTIGCIPVEHEAANLSFQPVSSRCERASLIVTSNKEFGRWGEGLRR